MVVFYEQKCRDLQSLILRNPKIQYERSEYFNICSKLSVGTLAVVQAFVKILTAKMFVINLLVLILNDHENEAPAPHVAMKTTDCHRAFKITERY